MVADLLGVEAVVWSNHCLPKYGMEITNTRAHLQVVISDNDLQVCIINRFGALKFQCSENSKLHRKTLNLQHPLRHTRVV